MKNLIPLLASLCLVLASCSAQRLDEQYISKVQTLDGIMETLYGVISGATGEQRNWELFHYLFKPDAKLIPAGKNKEGKVGCRYMSPTNYAETSGKWLEEKGFFEREIHRKVEEFGNITHVFSTYESYHTQEDTVPFMRGINSIQLLKDQNRWWIINIYWTNESEDNPLPAKYLN